MLLLDTEAPDEQRQKVLDDAHKIITDGGGSIVSDHDWGIRPMAYEIRHKDDAEYHLVQFNAGADVLGELNRALSIADGLVRFRVIKLAPGTPPPPDARAAEEPVVA